MKIEQTKHYDDASRIRELESSLTQALEDKKKIECVYIDTSNSLKKALQEIEILSRRFVFAHFDSASLNYGFMV